MKTRGNTLTRLGRAEDARDAVTVGKRREMREHLGLPPEATEAEVTAAYQKGLIGAVRRYEQEHGPVTPLPSGGVALAALPSLSDTDFMAYCKGTLIEDGLIEDGLIGDGLIGDGRAGIT